MIEDPSMLWVRVLWMKYNCGSTVIPQIKSYPKASHILRGVVNNWSYISKNILWSINKVIMLVFGKMLGSLECLPMIHYCRKLFLVML